jgi:hypothetical protein
VSANTLAFLSACWGLQPQWQDANVSKEVMRSPIRAGGGSSHSRR